MRRKHLLTMTAALCVGACQDADGEAARASLVDAFERAESLGAKFEIYEEMYASERPPNLSLAPALGELGQEVYFLALGKAQTEKSLLDVMASLEVIREFTTRNESRCSDSDMNLIQRNVKEIVETDNLEAITMTIQASCRSNRKTALVIRRDDATSSEGL